MDTSPLPAISARNPQQVRIAAAELVARAAPGHETWLVSLAADAAALGIEPGDTVGVIPPALAGQVEGVVAALGLVPGSPARATGDQPVGAWLSTRELSIPSMKLLRLAGLAPAPGPHSAAPPVPDALDVIASIPDAPAQADAILATLRPAAPRAFSLASSPREEERLDLIVGHHPTEREGRMRAGVASSLLTTAVGANAAIFPIPNPQFRLPDDGSDLLLIATGTGYGPFRAFLRERGLTGAPGRAWLVYGERGSGGEGGGERRSAFEDEFSAALASGSLSRVDVAMSTRQDGPRYVQEVLQEFGPDVVDWLDAGARIYACGNAGMVESIGGALAQVLVDELGISAGEAVAQVEGWRESGRLALDVFA
ncbi:hypothetical protein GCM10010401_04150 [Rarobacter faecitabidus]|uniref:Flavin-dependent oxidoreductase n=1 Tax=Rarobacter faecitabidus TaxID=13243 RepID=A0A542ZU63_RARFA|nr:hypothetical protein [Rarobacter faecitabidus]TQL63829.1 flavin-dependent oxidoreductase [Rarobacter faecitabidus]